MGANVDFWADLHKNNEIHAGFRSYDSISRFDRIPRNIVHYDEAATHQPWQIEGYILHHTVWIVISVYVNQTETYAPILEMTNCVARLFSYKCAVLSELEST